ncbi:MAG: hypothetical protein CMJ78_23810 [Planctomycetaceae bacterium]|nr:hypothetical protein [Planctomycetaceae bacterium]
MHTTIRFTVPEYDFMINAGLFDERQERLELIYGEIVAMPPINPSHSDTIDILNYWSIENTPKDEVRVRIQNDIGLPELNSVPEPDIAWVAAKSYRKERPRGEDVLLIIEVAESSLRTDRTLKAKLYAEAGVQDYWIVNLNEVCIEVYRQPHDGQYQDKTIYKLGDTVHPLAFPDVSLDVAKPFAQ